MLYRPPNPQWANYAPFVFGLFRAAVDVLTKRYPGVFRVRFRNRKGRNQLSNTWFIRYSFRGKQIREKTGTTDEEAAHKVLLQRLHDIGQGRLVQGAGKVTSEDLERLVHDDLVARGKATADRLGKCFRHIHEFFQALPMIEVRPKDLTGYVNARLKAGGAPGTIDVELAWLSRGFRLAVRSDMLPRVPEFPKMQVDNARMVFADWNVVERLIEHAPEYLRPIILTAHFSGWRREAILNRERSLHLDLVGRWLYLQRAASKGRMQVRIWLNDTLYEVMRAQDAKAREIERRTARMVPWVFFYHEAGANNEPGDRVADFDNAWRLVREAAGLQHLKFHDLRRGAIRELRQAGVSEHEIMCWVGLKTRAVFDRYDIVDEVRLRGIGERQQAHHSRKRADVTDIKREG